MTDKLVERVRALIPDGDGYNDDFALLMGEVVEALQPVEDAEVQAHIINISTVYPKASAAFERLAREKCKLEAATKALEIIKAASHIGDGTTAIAHKEKFYSCQAFASAALKSINEVE